MKESIAVRRRTRKMYCKTYNVRYIIKQCEFKNKQKE